MLETLRALSRQSHRDAPCRIRFLFYARPEAMLGADRVEAVRFRRTRLEGVQVVDTDETFDVPADLVVSCIGYEPVALGEEMNPSAGVFTNEDGRIDDGLYVVGWAKRGPSGTIATNRAESHAVADRLLAETAPAGRPGRAGLDRLLADRGVRAVDFAGWQRIEAAEAARAEGQRPRRKFASVAEMLASLDDEAAS